MKMLNKFIGRCAGAVLAAAMAVSNLAFAADTEEYKLPSGLTVEGLSKKIKILMSEDPEDAELPATSAIVFRGNEILYSAYFGSADQDLSGSLGHKIPVVEDTVYEWGSITKTMTWVSVMQLWEQGRIDLDRDVREYLPNDFFDHLSYDDPITMMNLMNHQGGWCENTYRIFVDDESEILSLEEALRANEPTQAFRPGEVSSYSNWGTALAGLIVERVSGMDYADYIHENILQPLNMEHTSIAPDHRDNPWVRQKREELHTYEYNMFGMSSDGGTRMFYIPMYPAGSAAGTIGDLAAYAQAFVDDSHPLFEKAETQEMLFSGTSFYGDSDIPLCSYGFWSEEHGVRTYAHDGGTHSGFSNMVFDPVSKVGLVAFTTNNEYNPLWQELSKLVFGELPKDKYSDGSEKTVKLEGYYLMTRSNLSGIMKLAHYLSPTSAEDLGSAADLGNGLLQLDVQGMSMLIAENTLSDGTKTLVLGAGELIPDSFYILKLYLIGLFFIAGILSVFVLLGKRKLKKAGMVSSYGGDRVITAGHFAKVVSVAAMLWLMSDAYSVLGLSKTVGTIVGITELVCLVVCIAAALTAAVSLFMRKSAKTGRICFIISILGNVITVGAITFFEMYKFWNC